MNSASPTTQSSLDVRKGTRQPIRSASSEYEHSATAANPRWKRLLDLSLISIALPAVLFALILVILWIKLFSRGPALFRQKRIGKNGVPFTLYKLRSMKIDSDTSSHEAYIRQLVQSDRPMIKLDLLCDSRMIPGGCLLRAAGLDELPQLLNILRGEMSLVGPRPCLPQEYPLFSDAQQERFTALPGLTGYWQVNGKNQTSFREMASMDIDYIRHASLSADLQIILRTPSVVAFQLIHALRNAYRPPWITNGRSKSADSCPNH
jgi:lipopolysaccharide/colanic/teichoic acid biosynthesis glycosyltransferase